MKLEDAATIAALTRHLVPATNSPSAPAPGRVASPKLSAIIKHFLQDQGTRGITEMMKKHALVMPLVLDVIGDKPVADLRQADLLDLFDVINRLPKHAKYDFEKGKPYREIALIPDRERLGKATFDRTYRASISTLLDWAKTIYQDQGFPVSLTVEKLDYRGSRKEGENKQRAFTIDELKRLFEGEETATFAADPALAHQFWLPHIGLFTGARVNEICQINPHTDIRRDADGIWYFLITDETEGDENIKKSVKTSVTREVPIHRTLIELGILDYVDRIKGLGAKLLFPEWKPKGGRAAPEAGEWFIDFLKELHIHGVMNDKGRAIRGSHAFRHTLLSYGKASKPSLNLRCISGHKEKSDNEVADGYEDDAIIRPLAEKKRLLDSLDYGLSFHRPTSPQRPTGSS